MLAAEPSASQSMDFESARHFALQLAGTVEQPHFHYGSFRVGGRIYATFPPEQRFLHVFVDDAQRAAAALLEPEAISPLHWGKRVVGARVELANASAELTEELLTQAWRARVQLPPVALKSRRGTARSR
jgi:hypothetical protein